MSRGRRFLRLRTSILDSSLLLEDLPTRWLFLTMLILADDAGTGDVDMPVERLAVQAGLSVRQVGAALEKLCAPDPNSRSQKEDGRRLTPLGREDGMAPRGWKIVNWEDYKRDAEAEQAAIRQQRKRAKDSTTYRDRHARTVTHRDTTVTKRDMRDGVTPEQSQSRGRGIPVRDTEADTPSSPSYTSAPVAPFATAPGAQALAEIPKPEEPETCPHDPDCPHRNPGYTVASIRDELGIPDNPKPPPRLGREELEQRRNRLKQILAKPADPEVPP